ncbi:hypothetical protein P175DRAFT_07687 [Aspergillus ochraceoroseus IBT 24754]|uniref:Uncharacterized protein n=1 Tax=Aspergillus ochraceoroseus IBT 24754 TaxID=1392256 RepID=A0A2T5M5N7_9EURO|nr:uncharacterized protein P175DRAFT_07687 [Aspergillus ochraceoroseus IBT 24754]PTU23848.1 hypothetical protein P175DRAFT_07687 [Aspergillus ochraceoroseus IBT 24754]
MMGLEAWIDHHQPLRDRCQQIGFPGTGIGRNQVVCIDVFPSPSGHTAFSPTGYPSMIVARCIHSLKTQQLLSRDEFLTLRNVDLRLVYHEFPRLYNRNKGFSSNPHETHSLCAGLSNPKSRYSRALILVLSSRQFYTGRRGLVTVLGIPSSNKNTILGAFPVNYPSWGILLEI